MVRIRKLSRSGIDLTVMAVTHGNEVAGIAVINRLLEHIQENVDFLSFSLGIILGNTPASRENVRFRQRDLNRSFDFKGESNTYEVHEQRS